MSKVEVLPELKQIVGALLFAARKPLTVGDLRRVVVQVAEDQTGAAKDFGKVNDKQIVEAVDALRTDLAATHTGMQISEVAKGYRLENEAGCGPWVRQMLEKGKAARLSRPALETLAIIAYRQPATRAQIEAVRGVAVDQIVRNLLEMQLVRVAGRSELPGRPWLFGTTQKFMEHFGLRSLDDLPGVEELRTLIVDRKPKPATGHATDEEPESEPELPLEDADQKAGKPADDGEGEPQPAEQAKDEEEERIDLAPPSSDKGGGKR